MKINNTKRGRIYHLLFGWLIVCQCWANEPDMLEFNLEQLLQVKVISASYIEESLIDAPAAIIIITEQDFKKRNYLSLVDILADLPGFDVIESNASAQVTFYQRGYRTPFSTRTLFMINGVVDNQLWSQEALISRQYPVSNIKQVEVLYGPTSVIYGPNAFLGIINVITKNADEFASGEHQVSLSGHVGSWNSRAAEITALGNVSGIKYNLSARFFSSDEEDLSGRWGFLQNEQYSNPDIWGPLLNFSNDGTQLGEYADPTDDYGVFAEAEYKQWQFGLIHWQIDEGFGSNYAADRAQANADWKRSSNQYYLRHNWSMSDQLKITSFAAYHDSRIWGNWAEAEPDWRVGMQDYALISLTNWNSTSNSLSVKQDYNFQLNDEFSFIGGWRFQRKDVTKAYDVPGYWDGVYSSTTPIENQGPHGYGAGIFHSLDPIYTFNSFPLDEVPAENRQKFDDKGIYVGTTYDAFPWRLNLGVRRDNNEIWGSSTNPRVSAIYKFAKEIGAIKLVYGEAFQEPSAQQLYGGWNGRNANPNLQPENARNAELIVMLQAQNWLHDISYYSAQYSNVIQEDAINITERKIHGIEYRGKFEYPNFWRGTGSITGNLFYTYTRPRSDHVFNHQTESWQMQNVDLGDIAPHKINASINIPFTENWNFNFKANYISPTKLYSRNPLSEQGIEISSRTFFDSALNYQKDDYLLSLKVENMFDKEAFAPGLRSANSGNDFTQRSQGYNNSLTPLPGRSVWLSMTINY